MATSSMNAKKHYGMFKCQLGFNRLWESESSISLLRCFKLPIRHGNIAKTKIMGAA